MEDVCPARRASSASSAGVMAWASRGTMVAAVRVMARARDGMMERMGEYVSGWVFY
jgi:hypothetical protein